MLDVDLSILLDVKQELFFLIFVLKGIETCDDYVCVENETRGLLDSRSNLLHLGKTLQREGLVKPWLRPATLAEQKRTMEK